METLVALWLHVIIILLTAYHIRLSVHHVSLCNRHIEELMSAIRHLTTSREEFHTSICQSREELDHRADRLLFALDTMMRILRETFPDITQRTPLVSIANA